MDRHAAEAPRRVVRCPDCGGDSIYAPSNSFRPFCSERCRLADLGSWASESYSVGTSDPAGEDGDREDPVSDA